MEYIWSMTRLPISVSTACMAMLLLFGCAGLPADSSIKKNHEGLYAFTDVTIVPMTEERLIPHQSVLIQDGIIVAIGPAGEVEAPAGAVVIDGRGRYLMPGLVDMHTHICDRDDLILLTANGVTSVRNMAEYPGWARLFGFSKIAALNHKIERGDIPGPTIYTTGPVLEGRNPVSPLFNVITDVEDAERAVRKQNKSGYELIKVYDNLSPDVYQRILEVASELQMPVVGHVPKTVGFEGALDGGQYSIEHLTAYIDNDRADFVIPENRIEEFAGRTAAAGIWNCPTLTIYDNLVPPSEFSLITSHPEARYVPGRIRFLWKKTLEAVYEAEYSGPDYAQHMREISRDMTRALHQAGARLVAGTDMNFVGVFPGVSLHRELANLVAAGLSPYEALACATVNAAECLGRSHEFGTVEIGQRADLILVEANPFNDIGAVCNRAGVMVRGVWHTRENLDRIIEKL
ncbi:MAG: amidohydrolase family protein [Spirochaetaceae bacterium]|nr:MAG: amidohydrolase family protein [Spirochaetaceae bacterium]